MGLVAEKRCCVPGCGLDSEILHKFPNPSKDIDRFKTWIRNVGGDILGKADEYIFKYRRVCHLHFEVKYHTRSKMLSANAVPTLNLIGFSSVRNLPQIDIANQPVNDPLATPSSGFSSVRNLPQIDIANQPVNDPLATPSLGFSSVRNLPQIDIANQPVNDPLATPSLGFSPVKNLLQIDIPNQPLNDPLATPSSGNRSLTDITNQALSISTAAPSTSDPLLLNEDPMESDDLQEKTVNSVKSRTKDQRDQRMNEQKLLKEIKKLQKEIESYKHRLNKARKLSTNSAFQKVLKKLKPMAAIFMIMQFREITKPKMGRRFTKEEQIMALALYKEEPQAYRWLVKSGFVLPSPITLSRLVTKAYLKA